MNVDLHEMAMVDHRYTGLLSGNSLIFIHVWCSNNWKLIFLLFIIERISVLHNCCLLRHRSHHCHQQQQRILSMSSQIHSRYLQMYHRITNVLLHHHQPLRQQHRYHCHLRHKRSTNCCLKHVTSKAALHCMFENIVLVFQLTCSIFFKTCCCISDIASIIIIDCFIAIFFIVIEQNNESDSNQRTSHVWHDTSKQTKSFVFFFYLSYILSSLDVARSWCSNQRCRCAR